MRALLPSSHLSPMAALNLSRAKVAATPTDEMRHGVRPARYTAAAAAALRASNASMAALPSLVLLHGYCAKDNPWCVVVAALWDLSVWPAKRAATACSHCVGPPQDAQEARALHRLRGVRGPQPQRPDALVRHQGGDAVRPPAQVPHTLRVLWTLVLTHPAQLRLAGPLSGLRGALSPLCSAHWAVQGGMVSVHIRNFFWSPNDAVNPTAAAGTRPCSLCERHSKPHL